MRLYSLMGAVAVAEKARTKQHVTDLWLSYRRRSEPNTGKNSANEAELTVEAILA
jgi:hypothetical protein